MLISTRRRTADWQAKGKSRLLASCLHVESLCPDWPAPCRFLPPGQAPSAAGGPELQPLQANSPGPWLEAPPSTSLPGNTWLPPPCGKLQTLRAGEKPGADCPHPEPRDGFPAQCRPQEAGASQRNAIVLLGEGPPLGGRGRGGRPTKGPLRSPASPLLRFPLRISKLRGHNAPLKAESPRFCDTTKPSCRLALSGAPSAK